MTIIPRVHRIIVDVHGAIDDATNAKLMADIVKAVQPPPNMRRTDVSKIVLRGPFEVVAGATTSGAVQKRPTLSPTTPQAPVPVPHVATPVQSTGPTPMAPHVPKQGTPNAEG